ncbi:hypothetical protein ACFT2C_20825 [Promicromonospora sp. NPDC057138]|uniref:hypothetical protein n=1 Tax=Promicromonospora sp. NPDC057138 TaxID=3346031 RepID=UPI0036352319
MITSEMVSILSVGLPALGALVSAIVSFLGILPGTERRLHRLVSIHNEMPVGEGKAALEEAVNELAVRTARRVVAPSAERKRERKQLDGGKVGFAIFFVLVGGGVAWGIWFLGSLAHALPVLQWTLWVIAILVTLFTTFFVTVGGLTDLYKDEEKDKENKAKREANKARREAAKKARDEARSGARDEPV